MWIFLPFICPVFCVPVQEVVMLLLQYDACPSVINGSAQIPKDITHDEEIRSMLEGMPTHIINDVT